jgi:hypothetical protein
MNAPGSPQDVFDRRWVCMVVRTGYHNGCRCTPSDPHGGWGCEYRWEASLTDAEARRYGFAGVPAETVTS